MYHYTESGLDNVYLNDGYTIHKTVYGEGVSIEDTDGLHRAIGKWLVEMPKPLNGAEVRFLRLEMDQTQRDLAAFFGTSEQTVRLWERKRNKASLGWRTVACTRCIWTILGDFSVRVPLKVLADCPAQIVASTAATRDAGAHDGASSRLKVVLTGYS